MGVLSASIRVMAMLVAMFFAGLCLQARGEVAPEQAARLRTTLTPMGAERAGNAAGTIPAWTGGFSQAIPGYRQGDPRPDPFADERPIFTITAANYQNFADRLPEGASALFRAFPDFRMNVFSTHRTAAFPQSVYDNVFLNARRAHAAEEGIAAGVSGAAGGVPFPIPHDGTEIVWNHLLSFWGAAREVRLRTYIGAADGTVELSAAYREITDFPYYYARATPETFGDYYFKTRRIQTEPVAQADEAYVAWQPIDTARDPYVAWRLLPGEHRVRKAPSLSYDTPDPDASGLEALDEYYLYFGGPDRYNFKILGKREMIVPYNNNRMYLHPAAYSIGPHHENPDSLRYELHRVWVVEGTLAPGKHHVVPRRRLYIDEDSWLVLYSDSWDEEGKLWKFGHATVYLMPEVPSLITGTQFVYDLLRGDYAADFVFAGDAVQYKVTAPHDAYLFSAQGLADTAER